MWLSALVPLIIPLATVIYCAPSAQLTEYGYLRLQPEIDQIDVEAYLKNTRLVKLQLQCLLLDRPCDIVGRWLKPRVKGALVGECQVCTKKQQENFDTWLNIIMERYPDFYRAAIVKYLQNTGITVSPEDKALVEKTLKDEDAFDKAVSERVLLPHEKLQSTTTTTSAAAST